jgi:amidophosphoribosyltransferase
MSDDIKHECGLAFIRLRKPFSYYLQKHGTVLYGLHKLYLLMEKQHNRGQDGAGIAAVKLNIEPGHPFMHRIRSIANQPLADIFSKILGEVSELEKYQPEISKHPGLMKGNISFLGELLLGHLRYGTHGKNNVEFCHPFIKRDTIPARNLALGGNFNLVNTDELFALVNVEPAEFQKQSDLAAMMEVIHHFLVKADQLTPGELNLVDILRKAVSLFDGGFTVGGLVGNGDAFVFRDANGIRPAYYYANADEIVAASERSAIRTVFNVGENEVL